MCSNVQLATRCIYRVRFRFGSWERHAVVGVVAHVCGHQEARDHWERLFNFLLAAVRFGSLQLYVATVVQASARRWFKLVSEGVGALDSCSLSASKILFGTFTFTVMASVKWSAAAWRADKG